MDTENITGIILEGGNYLFAKNNNVGLMKEEIMVRTVHNLLLYFCSDILVSTNQPEKYYYLEEKTIPNEYQSIGPIGGILSCLRTSKNQKNLVVAYDMPMVPVSLLQLLVNHKNDADFVVPAAGNDYIEPLCAIYDKSVIFSLEEMILKGDYSLHNLHLYCQTSLIQLHNGNDIFRNKNILKDIAAKN